MHKLFWISEYNIIVYQCYIVFKACFKKLKGYVNLCMGAAVTVSDVHFLNFHFEGE